MKRAVWPRWASTASSPTAHSRSWRRSAGLAVRIADGGAGRRLLDEGPLLQRGIQPEFFVVEGELVTRLRDVDAHAVRQLERAFGPARLWWRQTERLLFGRLHERRHLPQPMTRELHLVEHVACLLDLDAEQPQPLLGERAVPVFRRNADDQLLARLVAPLDRQAVAARAEQR